jgi:hypothetical protein
MKHLITFLFATGLLVSTAFAQININDEDLSFDERMEIGKAYIDETFPDCDIESFAPHNIFTSKKDAANEENLTKETWVYLYPHEYELYMYYQNAIYEASLTPEERQLRDEADEKGRLEKEEYLKNEKNNK